MKYNALQELVSERTPCYLILLNRNRQPAAERALRTVALGRKNYLFAGSNAGGERAAAIYILL
jgi:hypothetical protein